LLLPNRPKKRDTAEGAGTGAWEASTEVESICPLGAAWPKSSILNAGLKVAGGAGEAGLEGLPMMDAGLLGGLMSEEVRVKAGAVGLFTSRIPPPEVVS